MTSNKPLSAVVLLLWRIRAFRPILFPLNREIRKLKETRSLRSLMMENEESKTIAHEIGGIQTDALRFGLQGVKSEIIGSHPLESAYRSTRKNQEQMKRRILANTYGSAFPFKMDLEKEILSRFQRPPGPIPSSMLGLEALTGSLDDFGFEDYLNDPRESETFRPLDMHHGMEVRLGISKGPVCPSFI